MDNRAVLYIQLKLSSEIGSHENLVEAKSFSHQLDDLQG